MRRSRLIAVACATLLTTLVFVGESPAQNIVLFTHPRVTLSTNPQTPTVMSVWCIGCSANTSITYTAGGNTWSGTWNGHGPYILNPGYFPDLITMTHQSGDPSNLPSSGPGNLTVTNAGSQGSSTGRDYALDE